MKKISKVILCLVLVASMVLPLAGCGKGDSESVQERKEYYYVPEYHDFPMEFDYINNAIISGDTLYLFVALWNEITGSAEKLYQYDLLTGEYTEVSLEIGENDSIQQVCMNSEGNFLMITSRYEQKSDGNEEEALENEEASLTSSENGTEEEITAEADAEADAEGADTGENENEAASSEEITVISETSISSSASSVVFYGNDSIETEYENYIELWELSAADGSVVSKKDIKHVFDDSDIWIQYMVVDDKDNIYVSDGNRNIYLLDASGEKFGSISVDNWIESLFATKEGNVYAKFYGSESMEVHQVDPQSKSLSEAVAGASLNTYNQVYYKGQETSILVRDESSVFTYDFGTDTKEELFDWLDADINSDDVYELGQLSDGRMVAILRDYSREKTEYTLVYLTKTPAAEVAEKEELVYGTIYLNQTTRKAIIDFNKSSDLYHITVKDYYNSDDYMAGITQFNNDLTSGNGPDIIDISSIDLKQYASKGVFEDLYPYMEKDGIDKSDYLENVLKAYESNGKLCGITSKFYVSTTLAKASKVGNVAGWTLDEMLDFAESNDVANLFQYGSRSWVLYYCIYNNIDEFIDWENGKCQFDGDDFIRVLEFANKFPEEPDYNNEEGTAAKLRADKVLLMNQSISSIQEYQMLNGLFGEKIAFVGYPDHERKGNLIQPADNSMAISSKSKHKDAAWEFIKTMLSDEYQNGLVSEWSSWGFPIKKSALEKQFELDMTPEYYEDENGNQIEQTKTSWGYDDFQMDIYAATQEEVDAVWEILSSAEKISSSTNEELTNIITEETEAFFKGQKSAKDTAEVIQNRIQIYVNENS